MNNEKTGVNEMIPLTDKTPTQAPVSAVNTEQALADWEAYQKLCDDLLDKNDYQGIGDKRFKKKSAWRKLGKAFNISTKIVDEDITRDETGQIISAKYTVEASTPDGRTSLGLGICSIYDKITYNNPTHKKYIDKGENVPPVLLRLSFSNAEHDVPATAYTRAVNRAISDQIGCGEVSAEEINDTGNNNLRTIHKRTKENTEPKTIDTTAKTTKQDKTTKTKK